MSNEMERDGTNKGNRIHAFSPVCIMSELVGMCRKMSECFEHFKL
jgi:hypothetical protein